MIYLDSGATSFHKPPEVLRAVQQALMTCASPGRGGYPAAMEGARQVFECRRVAAELFDCLPEQVVFTHNCTQGLNMAIRSLVLPGDRVVISGFEHNAVTRPLAAIGADVCIAGRKLFDQADTLEGFEKALSSGIKTAILTHVSNVFGYILPVEEIANLCRKYGANLVLDAAQSAGVLPVKLRTLGAAYIAMPGHKGLLGPQGTGILLCGQQPEPLLFGGTGTESRSQRMPEYLPERAEAGTLNVPGICGLRAGMEYIKKQGTEQILNREHRELVYACNQLKNLGIKVYTGQDQAGTVSFVPPGDCEEFAEGLAKQGIAVRAGIHCAPIAHESAGTLDTGTVRVSFGYDAQRMHTQRLVIGVRKLLEKAKKF